jgi:acetylornithine/succinyldiaminopimelate/putrescine aminotransferase
MTATVFRKPLEEFFRKNPFIHVSTFGGSELGVEVALKVLEISSSPDFLANVNALAEYFARGFEKLKAKFPKTIAGFRQLGLMMGIEFYDQDLGPLFTKAAYDVGMLAIYANNDKRVVQLLPPLIIEQKHADEILDKIERAVKRLKYYKPLFDIAEFLGKFF